MDSYYPLHHHLDMNRDSHLPPGFRFHPTDEELITYYLLKKVLDSTFTGRAIAEVDLNKCEPWELPEKAKMGEKEWYFFSLRDRKYPTGLRTNRATEAGYWKATGKDREIYSSKTCSLVGMKKTLVFYRGRAPKGEKSNWVMHEYRLEGKFAYHYLSRNSKDEWVISRVFQKNSIGGGNGSITTVSSTTSNGSKKTRMNMNMSNTSASNSMSLCPEPSSPSSVYLPPLLDSSPYHPNNTTVIFDNNTTQREHVSCFSTISAATAAVVSNNNNTFNSNASFDLVPPQPLINSDPFARFQRNSQLPFFFSQAAQPFHGDFLGWPVTEEQKVQAESGSTSTGMALGSTELDCMWGY